MIVALSAALLVASQTDGPFSNLSYEAALEQAKATEKLLLVDFVASWCQPCKRMEKETWGRDEVRAWIGTHAIAIQVDVNKDWNLAKRFEVKGMPTVVAVRGGHEFDRTVGFRDAAGFLAWGQDVVNGKRSSDKLIERAEALQGSDDVDARYDLAKDLYRARKYEEALEHYLWLWPATRDASGYAGVRTSFMLHHMADLAKEHEPARKAFFEILEALQQKIDAAEVPTYPDWKEWSAMCEYFNEKQRIIAWYEKRRDEHGQLFSGKAGDFGHDHILEEVFNVLLKTNRPLDAVRLYEDARVRARTCVSHYRRMKEATALFDQEEEVRKSNDDFNQMKLSGDMSSLYAALLVARRTVEAGDVATLLIQTLDSPDSRLALVRAGLDTATRPQPEFSRWLDEAETAGANVRVLRERLARLEERVKEPGKGK